MVKIFDQFISHLVELVCFYQNTIDIILYLNKIWTLKLSVYQILTLK